MPSYISPPAAPGPYAATMRQEGSTYIARNSSGGTISSGTSAVTVFNAAVDAIAATATQDGGGTLFVSRGVYNKSGATSFTLKKGVQLLGEGWSGAISDGGYEQYGTVFTATTTGAIITANVANGAYGCRVSNIAMDGNATATAGIQADSADFRVTDFFIHAINGNGLDFNDSSSYYRMKVRDGLITECLTGIDVNGPSDGLISHVVCRACYDYSIALRSGGWQVFGCHLTTVKTGATNLYMSSTPGGIIGSNYFDMYRDYNIDITSSGNRATITNNYFLYSSNSNPIIRMSAANGCTIGNNTYYGGNNAANFVKLTSWPDGTRIVGNTGTGLTGYEVEGPSGEDLEGYSDYSRRTEIHWNGEW